MTRDNRRLMRAGVVIASFALLASACGGGATGAGGSQATEQSDVTKVAEYKGADRHDKLVAGAKKEGELQIYTSMGLEDIGIFVENFNEKYPFLKVQIYSATGERVAQRMLTEYQAGAYESDVLQLTGTDVGHLKKAGYLQHFYTPNAPEGVDQDKLGGIPVYVNRLILAWNTEQVSSDEVPDTYEGLLDPKWRGKIGIEAADTAWMATLLGSMGEQEGTQFFEQLSKLDPFVQDSHTTLSELVARGEVPISPTIYGYDAEGLKQSGAPIDWKPLEPVVLYPHSVSLPSRSQHPNAAMLFIDYMLSEDGQKVIAGLGRTPANPEVAPKYPALQLEDAETAVLDPVTWVENFSDYQKQWEGYFRSG